MEAMGLIISCLLTFGLMLFLHFNLKGKNQLKKIFIINTILVFFWCLLLLGQKYFCSKYNINPIIFEWFIYICACFLPVSILFTGIIFANTKIILKKQHLLLFIIPILSLIVLWTNEIHNLFYIQYSTIANETIFGKYFYIHTIYTYALYFIGIFYLIKYSIKNSGIFSKQAILIIFAFSIPIFINLLGMFKIVPMSIYATPICFSFTMLFCVIAIFKFKFISVTPIALQRIVDNISDSYIVLNEDNIITDFNQTFLSVFNFKSTDVRNKNIVDIIHKSNENNINLDSLIIYLDKVKTSSKSFHFEKHFVSVDKYFNIEINNIKSKGNFLGTLILLKDITQHVQDLDTIKSNQDLLMEKERLASLGQLIGGIAHNLKTPIMSISGAAEGIIDLIKEYNESIGNPVVTEEDHKAIAKDMQEWVEKIKTHSSYMSDVITAVKGQAVTLSEQEVDTFTLEELVKRVNILMKHELKNALIELNIHLETDPNLELKGNVNSLVQVINNMISNAIQAYNGETNKTIDMFVHIQNKNVKISIQDYGMGMTKEVQSKLFKEMITTKGKNGTGLGLFMSYSTIRAHFNGNINFESEPEKGTTFHIILPI